MSWRKRHAVASTQLLQRARIDWHGVTLNQPDWSEHSHSLAFTLQSLQARFLLHGMLNAYWEPLTFELPPPRLTADSRGGAASTRRWRHPMTICAWEKAPFVRQRNYVVPPRSVVVLLQVLQAESPTLLAPRVGTLRNSKINQV